LGGGALRLLPIRVLPAITLQKDHSNNSLHNWTPFRVLNRLVDVGQFVEAHQRVDGESAFFMQLNKLWNKDGLG
jgi:hypothetical protein